MYTLNIMKKLLLIIGIIVILSMGGIVLAQKRYFSQNLGTNTSNGTTSPNVIIKSPTAISPTPKQTTTPKSSTTVTPAQTAFKQCDVGTTWMCKPITKGEYDPQNSTETVCGCGPSICNRPNNIIVSGSTGAWPDGTAKGTFQCTTDDAPAADRQ
jgi:hypothetical protein